MPFSDTSSSVSSADYDRKDRGRERRRKKDRKLNRRSDNSDDERRHRRRTSSRTEKKMKKRRKKSSKEKRKKDRKRHPDTDESSLYSSNNSDSDYSRRRRHRRSKKERKRRRREDAEDNHKTKKSRIDTKEKSRKESSSSTTSSAQTVSLALHNLLIEKPDFGSELPLILIRLAGGTTFDLGQVTDPSIATGLRSVFEALEIYGVKKQQSSGMWMFQNPPCATRRDELVLLKVIRSLLDEIGLTMEELAKFENKQRVEKEEQKQADETLKPDERKKMKEFTLKILEKFLLKDATLGSQLATLCMTIVEGESVSVDGIPDENLKTALESLFEKCGLEKSEIEEDDEDDDDDDSDESPLMGYGLPDSSDTDNDIVQMKLAIMMSACREGPPKRKSIGPTRRPMTAEEEQALKKMYPENNRKEEEDNDEGPLLPGEVRKARGPAMSLEMIKAQAEHRELQLKATASGVPMPTNAGGREEWMIIPGEHDFLSGIKSGQAIKSRGFQNKKSRDADKKSQPIHPAVQAEMDSIMQAHQDARGPSLMDLHRSKKSQEKELASRANNGKKEWKWNRDKDLDAGRRVDKDALGMILGGAAGDLKSKFAGGFNR
ncbi:unnamed protein product [Pseudo-nitzschia multistriata]|uniref:DUF3752 domain-containing protein n=1 Tax=Pseudo-nitzschia multistriata TaxID=183589 RepID=A0A448YYF5_9STRA|nr:unnamed protein product [Pseudo-nitzschia multistriata]